MAKTNETNETTTRTVDTSADVAALVIQVLQNYFPTWTTSSLEALAAKIVHNLMAADVLTLTRPVLAHQMVSGLIEGAPVGLLRQQGLSRLEQIALALLPSMSTKEPWTMAPQRYDAALKNAFKAARRFIAWADGEALDDVWPVADSNDPQQCVCPVKEERQELRAEFSARTDGGATTERR